MCNAVALAVGVVLLMPAAAQGVMERVIVHNSGRCDIIPLLYFKVSWFLGVLGDIGVSGKSAKAKQALLLS